MPDATCCCLQLEEVATNLRRKQTHNQEDEEGEGAESPELQVLLYSSRRFGPQSIRELTVRHGWTEGFSRRHRHTRRISFSRRHIQSVLCKAANIYSLGVGAQQAAKCAMDVATTMLRRVRREKRWVAKL